MDQSDIAMFTKQIDPLQALFSEDQITLQQLMSLTDAEKHLKQEVTIGISKKFLHNTGLIKDVMDCALRPGQLKIQNMNITWPFLASQFLIHQQEIFTKSFFKFQTFNKIEKYRDDVFQTAQLLQWLFKILKQQKPINSTSAGYLLKIFNKIYYQNQQEVRTLVTQFYQYFVNNTQRLACFIEHFYNPSIAQLLWRIIDTYNQDLQPKVNIINQILEGVLINGPFVNQMLENIQTLFDNLIERSQEINTQKLSTQLCIQTFSERNIDLIKKLISDTKIDRQTLKKCTIVLNTLLKFFVQQKNPKKQLFKMSSSIDFITIPDQLLKQIVILVRQLFHLWFKNYAKQNNNQSKYQAIVCLHNVLKLNATVSQDLIFPKFIQLCILLFKNQPLNNIIHNQIKGILSIAFTTQAATRIITPQLLQFIFQSFNQQPQPKYLNQLFYISKMVQQCQLPSSIKNSNIRNKWNQYLNSKYNIIKQLYQTVLGKNTSPKKDFFTWQQQVQSEEGSEVEVVSFNKHSEDGQQNIVIQKFDNTGSLSRLLQVQSVSTNILSHIDENVTIKSNIQFAKSVESIELFQSQQQCYLEEQ